MKLLTRYIGINCIGATLIIGLLVAGLVSLFTLVAELSDIGKGDYTIFQAFYHVFLTAPLQFYQLYPMVALVGSLLAVGMLATRSELTVMRAAGYSISQIAWDVIKAGTLLLILMTALGELWVPSALQYANVQKADALNGGQAIQTQNGVWLRDRNNFLHIETVYPDKRMQGITRYEFNDNHQLIAESYIASGYYQKKKWILQDITQSVITPQGVTIKKVPESVADFNIYPYIFTANQVDPTMMSLTKLWGYMVFQDKSGQSATTYEYTFWRRVFQPFSTIVMMFLAVPFVFGSLRSVTIGLRMVFGMMLGGSFYLLNQFLGPVSLVYQVPPILAASIPSLLFVAVGIYLMRRM